MIQELIFVNLSNKIDQEYINELSSIKHLSKLKTGNWTFHEITMSVAFLNDHVFKVLLIISFNMKSEINKNANG